MKKGKGLKRREKEDFFLWQDTEFLFDNNLITCNSTLLVEVKYYNRQLTIYM